MACLRSSGISPVFSEALKTCWSGWASLLLHYLRIIAGNSSGPPEEFCEIGFIASMMCSLVMLMSASVFARGCPKKSFGYFIVIFGSRVLKMLLYCSFSSSLIFLLLGSRFPSSSWEVQFQLWSLSCFLWICRSILGFFLRAACVFLRFLSVFIEIFNFNNRFFCLTYSTCHFIPKRPICLYTDDTQFHPLKYLDLAAIISRMSVVSHGFYKRLQEIHFVLLENNRNTIYWAEK